MFTYLQAHHYQRHMPTSMSKPDRQYQVCYEMFECLVLKHWKKGDSRKPHSFLFTGSNTKQSESHRITTQKLNFGAQTQNTAMCFKITCFILGNSTESIQYKYSNYSCNIQSHWQDGNLIKYSRSHWILEIRNSIPVSNLNCIYQKHKDMLNTDSFRSLLAIYQVFFQCNTLKQMTF